MTLSFPPTFSTCPARSVGLREPPPVRELPMLRRFIKREHCHGGRPPKTPIFRMVCKKINYRLIRPKPGNVMISKHAQDTA